jgi:iron complex outermembrane receptor protein
VKYSDPDYNVGFEYDLSENSMFFADFTTSYRVSGNANSEANVLPEELKAYTAGSKNRFFGNKLQLNVSAYYYDYTNFHANAPPMMTVVDENENGMWDYDPETGEGETTQWFDSGMQQKGKARVYGFDIQSSTIITEKDRLDFSLSYIKKEFTDLLFDFDAITNWLGLADLDYSGREMPQAPNWNAKGTYEHNFNLTNGGLLSFRLDGSYTSDYNINWLAYQTSISIDLDTGDYSFGLVDVSDVRYQEAYYLADASLVYNSPDGKWSLSGYVKNIQNYAVKRFMDGMGNMFIGDPRTYGAVLTVRY